MAPAPTGKASYAFPSLLALYPATSDTEKIHFNQLNKKTGHRIKILEGGC
jgi:non-homologous end joining protein Ku